MITTIIFDLSEVFISGIIGVEKLLIDYIEEPAMDIAQALWGEPLYEICHGLVTEDEYLDRVKQAKGWTVPNDVMKAAIRENFKAEVPGMQNLLAGLRDRYDVFLLSDHAVEWVAYIEQVHPFLQTFNDRVYSCFIGKTKKDLACFEQALEIFNRMANECVFVDDNPNNVVNAVQTGLNGISFTDTESLIQEFNSLGIGIPK